MATQKHHQSYFEEKLTLLALSSTYVFYSIGGVYVLGSAIGFLLLSIVGLRMFFDDNKTTPKISILTNLWHVSMLIMLIALLIGHLNWNLGFGQTIKSTIGWMKGWALMSIFVWLGASSLIRPHFVIRGVCFIAIHSLVFALISVAAYFIGLPGELYVSPLKIIGGPGSDFFKVAFYGINPETGAGRWQFFGPWAPSAGLISCLFLIISSLEKNQTIRHWAFVGCLVICLLSQSRAGWAIFIFLLPLLWSHKFMLDPRVLLVLGVAIPLVLLISQPLIEHLMDSYQQVKDARPDSTRVRNALANIAVQRWQQEAFWFGHGIVERGPKMVEYMPIGTHHSWYGLLFVKGFVGMCAFAIPLAFTFIYLLWQSLTSTFAHRMLCLVIVLICYSFFENLEILMYLCWPAFLMIGMAFAPSKLGEYDAKI